MDQMAGKLKYGRIHMKVSVIMLTYNREQYVGRMIESVLAQDFEDFEFIIVDNGSTDRSGEIADQYAENDDRIRVIHKSAGNIGSGRNAGLDIAAGEYIAFVDDDDYAEPCMLRILYELASQHNADMTVCGSWKEINGEKVPNFIFEETDILTPEEAVYEMLERKKMNIAMPTKMIRRELFESIRFSNDGKYDDINTGYKYPANSNKVVLCGTPLYTFYRHDGNNSGFTQNDKLLTPEQLDEYFRAYHERTEYLENKLPNLADYVKYSEWSFLISMYHKIVSNDLILCKEQKEYCKGIIEENQEKFRNSKWLKDFEMRYLEQYF